MSDHGGMMHVNANMCSNGNLHKTGAVLMETATRRLPCGRMSPRFGTCTRCSAALQLLGATSRLGCGTVAPRHSNSARLNIFSVSWFTSHACFPMQNHPRFCERCVETDGVMRNNGEQDVSKVADMPRVQQGVLSHEITLLRMLCGN